MSGLIPQLFQTMLAFAAVLLFARIIGKEQLSQLTYYDYINGITIGSIAAVIATDTPDKMWSHVFDLALFSVLTIIISRIVLKNRPLRKLLEGDPTIVIHNGKILEYNMNKIRYNMDDLLMQLRQKNVFDIGDVEFGIIETDGLLSVLLKSQKRPLRPEDLNLNTKYEGLDCALIIDGEILHKNLKQFNLDENWLKSELDKQGIKDVKEVTYAVLNSNGSLFVDRHYDMVNQRPLG